jgi:hypothetical protein
MSFAIRFPRLTKLEITYRHHQGQGSDQIYAPHFLQSVVQSGLHQRLEVLKLMCYYVQLDHTSNNAFLQAFFSVPWPKLTKLIIPDRLIEPLLQLAQQNQESLLNLRVLGEFDGGCIDEENFIEGEPSTLRPLVEVIRFGALPQLQCVVYYKDSSDSYPRDFPELVEVHRHARDSEVLWLETFSPTGQEILLQPLVDAFSGSDTFQHLR